MHLTIESDCSALYSRLHNFAKPITLLDQDHVSLAFVLEILFQKLDIDVAAAARFFQNQDMREY